MPGIRLWQLEREQEEKPSLGRKGKGAKASYLNHGEGSSKAKALTEEGGKEIFAFDFFSAY
jgi:hypothetical protein